MSKHVAVVGAGIAGIEAASILNAMGHSITLIEKNEILGGHINHWHQLFPNRRQGRDLLEKLYEKMDDSIQVQYGKEITSIKPFSGKFIVTAADGWVTNADAVLMATGFDLFDAHKKEEYGYGIYDHVITSADLEEIFIQGEGLNPRLGKDPQRIGFIHCVGSRDEKAGNIYCSKVCCITAVKQAIEIKELYPSVEVYCFYMDLRMFGRHYEELYQEAQEKHNIQFIRGRLSEASENKQGGVVVKVEDTLLGKPLKLTLDLLVLMSGMVAPVAVTNMRDKLGLAKVDDGFLKPVDPHTQANLSELPGFFMAGTATGPKTITDTLTDARSAALEIDRFLKEII
ncbi:MAG: CoB--CoM heterodisulfide reductase iron-sulfur subunit A family protein [Bacteroidetes bacterium]|nr:CoB--CoM heterodisulfide reductase iron-sulfur subunit A family protein [Bacteroidota bacterium]